MGRRILLLRGPKARMFTLPMARSIWTWQQVHRLPLLTYMYNWVNNEVLSAVPGLLSLEDDP